MSNIYDEAILVQDACNPSGVAHFLLKCFKHIRGVEGVTDTEAMCKHPLFVLVVNKLESLSGYHSDNAFSDAYSACRHRSDDIGAEDHEEEASKRLPGHPSSGGQPLTTAASLPRAATRFCWKDDGHAGPCSPNHDFADVRGSCNKTN